MILHRVEYPKAGHSPKLGHNFEFFNPKILDKDGNKKKSKKTIEILSNKAAINKRSDMNCFSNIYKKNVRKNSFLVNIYIFYFY